MLPTARNTTPLTEQSAAKTVPGEIPPPGYAHQLRVALFSGTVISEHLEPRSRLMDMGDGSAFGEVDQLHGFHVELEGFAGLALLVTAPRSELA